MGSQSYFTECTLSKWASYYEKQSTLILLLYFAKKMVSELANELLRKTEFIKYLPTT